MTAAFSLAFRAISRPQADWVWQPPPDRPHRDKRRKHGSSNAQPPSPEDQRSSPAGSPTQARVSGTTDRHHGGDIVEQARRRGENIVGVGRDANGEVEWYERATNAGIDVVRIKDGGVVS